MNDQLPVGKIEFGSTSESERTSNNVATGIMLKHCARHAVYFTDRCGFCEADTLRALLAEAIAAFEDAVGEEFDHIFCPYCNGEIRLDQMTHDIDCPVTVARRMLARLKEATASPK